MFVSCSKWPCKVHTRWCKQLTWGRGLRHVGIRWNKRHIDKNPQKICANRYHTTRLWHILLVSVNALWQPRYGAPIFEFKLWQLSDDSPTHQYCSCCLAHENDLGSYPRFFRGRVLAIVNATGMTKLFPYRTKC